MLKLQESIARDAESKRQAAVAAEQRSEEIVAQLSGRLTAKDAELYAVRKELEDKILKVGNFYVHESSPSQNFELSILNIIITVKAPNFDIFDPKQAGFWKNPHF